VKRYHSLFFCALAVIVAALAYDTGHGVLAIAAIGIALAAFPT